jgi:hypothetical protein
MEKTNETTCDKQQVKIQQIPGLVYIPEYIDITLEEYLLTQIYNQSIAKWKKLANRRLQNWGG